MKALNSDNKRCMGITILAISFLMWLVPGTAMSDTGFIELSGTFVPVEQKYGHKVYTVQNGDHRMYLRVAEIKTNHEGESILTDYSDGFYLRRSGIKRIRLIGNKETLELLNAKKTCDVVKISGFISYSTGRLRLRNVEPVKNDLQLASCNPY